MKAFRLHDFSGPDAWRLEDLPSPKPGPGEVLVRVKAASINYRDLMIVRGDYNPKMKLPRIPLSDGAGEVVANGPGAGKFKPGDRVTCNFMARWDSGPLDDSKAKSALGGEIDGVLAQEVALPECGLVRVPDHLDFNQAATLPCAALTAWHALFETGAELTPGCTVLTQGTGGVSVFAIQFAHLAGFRVIATSSSDEKLARAHELGATETINYKTTPDWERTVRELTGGEGVDLVVEVGGAGTLPKSLRAVRTGGTIALIGVLSGRGEVDPIPILMRGVRVQGVFVGSRVMFEDMNRAVSFGRLKPVVDRVYPFDDAPKALHQLADGSHFGKIVIGFD